MTVSGFGPVADAGAYGEYLDAIAGTTGIGPIADGNIYGQLVTGSKKNAPGSSGLFGFLNNLSKGAYPGIERLAGAGLGLLAPAFDVEESTKKLKEAAKETEGQIDQRISNIYPALTGLTGEEALNKYYNAFADTIATTKAEGRADLTMPPDIEPEYSRFGTRVDQITNQYSLANLVDPEKGYAGLALDPPVVTMDVGSIKQAADWTAPEIEKQYKQFMDYSGPQSSKFISGFQRDTADAIGRYMNTSGDVAGLMNYGTLA